MESGASGCSRCISFDETPADRRYHESPLFRAEEKGFDRVAFTAETPNVREQLEGRRSTWPILTERARFSAP